MLATMLDWPKDLLKQNLFYMRYFQPKTLILFLLLSIFSHSAFAISFQSVMGYFKPKTAPANVKVVNHLNKNVKGPTHIKVGIYVLHVSKNDLQSANYQMDFYVILKCDQTCQNINFELMNATDAKIRLVAKQKNMLIYRVQADINKINNLRNYPFDSHTIDIIIENRQLTNDKMIFESDPSTTALDSDLNVAGFYLLPTWTAKVTDHYYSVFQQTFSCYSFSMFVQRPWLAGFLKGILPAFIIVCCNFLALFMGISHISQRIGIATSTLIAAVVFHLNLTSSLPPLGYITFADMFMLLNYLCLLVVLLEVVITTYFIDTKHHDTAIRINKLSAWLIPLFWFFLQIVNWIVFNPISTVSGS